MKKLLLIFLVAINFNATAQKFVLSDVIQKFGLQNPEYKLNITEANKLVAYQKKDSALVVIDSAGTIEALLRFVQERQAGSVVAFDTTHLSMSKKRLTKRVYVTKGKLTPPSKDKKVNEVIKNWNMDLKMKEAADSLYNTGGLKMTNLDYRTTLEWKYPDFPLRGFSYNTTPPEIERDTIPVIMSIADTAHRFETYYQFKPCPDSTSPFVSCGENVTIDKGRNNAGALYWVYGYEVRQKSCCTNGYSGSYAIYKPEPWYTHLSYLNDQKKPLGSTKIVWISSPIK